MGVIEKVRARVAPSVLVPGELPLDRIVMGDCIETMRALPAKSVDLIFADPPYAKGSGSAAVEAVARAGWLAPGGWLSVETSRDDGVDAGDLTSEATRDVGRARLTLLRRA